MRNNYRLESRMRENRPCGSEGGEGVTPFRPLSDLEDRGGFQTHPKSSGVRDPGMEKSARAPT